MATIVLGTLGGIAGGAIGGPVGAVLGRALGAVAGSAIDSAVVGALTPANRINNTGPRLTTTDLQVSTEGSTIGRLYGRVRVQGNIIWATRFLEEITEETETTGGGKGGSPAPATVTVTTEYVYYGNFAIGLCEGGAAGFGRMFADGDEISPADYTIRFYPGSETQDADPLIEAKEGAAPAYRGLCYMVFERFPLGAFGNRIPQFSIEIFKPPGALEAIIGGVALIPGNEFGFDPELVQQTGTGGGAAENDHTMVAVTDVMASLDRLQMLAPEAQSVMVVVPWFGDDLRCGTCTVRPKVDSASKTTSPYSWAVGPLTRSTALVVSAIDGVPSSGGTPNDGSVIRLIEELNSRGLKVTLCPFIMMDIASGNVLPDPYSNGAGTNGQPVYPWRGRITCSPAAGYTGTVDQTATAGTQVDAFVGAAAAGDFGGSGTTITYSGPAEWSYRRFILHYATLAARATGGVDSFLVGTEMPGLTQVRSSGTAYPFVTALKTLAADVSGVLGAGVKVGYAADWTEYNCHRPDDGSGDVLFNLDPLWSDANIDFVGIDNYLPLSDWRDGTSHLDYDSLGPASIYDRDYLEGNVRGGEYFDFTYADLAARKAQTRTPITDADPANEPWLFRQKDILNWWSNAHHDRPAGVRSGTATDWTAQGKPIRFIELGCPAVDKGANQPNIFPDETSSEGGYPYFSSRARDDGMQRAFLETVLGFYADAGNNPVSTVYAASMVDLTRSHVWCWDARPWPEFPLGGIWSDASHWQTGHWISGRLGAAPAADTIGAILAEADFTAASIEPLSDVVDGVTVGNIVSPRSLLEGLQPAYRFDAVESDGVIRFQSRLGRGAITTIEADELVATDASGRLWQMVRGQETDLPDAVKVSYGDPARDDQPSGTEARRSAGASQRITTIAPPVVMAEAVARSIAESELHAAWVAREQASFALPPSRMLLDAGDVVDFAPALATLQIASIGESTSLSVSAVAVDPLLQAPVALGASAGKAPVTTLLLDPDVTLLDGAMLTDADADHAPYLAGVMSPFGVGLGVWRSPTTSGYSLDTLLTVPASMGVTTADFYDGPVWRWDRVNSLYVTLERGALASADEELVLDGANMLAIENADGEWEYLNFATATPNGTLSYILTDLLRGQRGTEFAMASPVAAGARVLLISGAVRQSSITPAQVGLTLNWIGAAASQGVGADNADTFAYAPQGRGRRPLAPVHLRGVRDSGTGDWTVSWTRRSRISADSWDQEDIPLGEETEGYQLEILSGPGGTVLRTFTTTAPSQLYTAAQQTADFGSAQYSFTARVSQLSATWGYGLTDEELVWVH